MAWTLITPLPSDDLVAIEYTSGRRATERCADVVLLPVRTPQSLGHRQPLYDQAFVKERLRSILPMSSNMTANFARSICLAAYLTLRSLRQRTNTNPAPSAKAPAPAVERRQPAPPKTTMRPLRC